MIQKYDSCHVEIILLAELFFQKDIARTSQVTNASHNIVPVIRSEEDLASCKYKPGQTMSLLNAGEVLSKTLNYQSYE